MIKKYSIQILLILITFLTAIMFLFKLTSSPPCLNADEATNAYDAYSILKTGKDQYGNLLPLRFKSFGDYKLPLLTYLAIPWIKVFGLTEFGIRMVNFPFVLLFPIIVFFLSIELFKNKNISLISSFLVSLSLGLQILGRQAHEGYLTAFLLTLSTYFFIKYINKQKSLDLILFSLTFFIQLFGYHSSRLWAGFYFLTILFFIFKKKISIKYLLVFFSLLFIFGISDFIYKPTRISNLLFFNNDGFKAKVLELKNEDKLSFIHNEITVGIKDLTLEYFKYISPQFLVVNGDKNIRFGYPGMSPVNPVEYILLLIGLYYLFYNKEKYRFFILSLLLFSPLSAILSWNTESLTRSFFIIIPILIISGYGFYHFIRKNKILGMIFILSYFYFLFYSWNFYLFHYPKRALTLRSWQCGYKELASYIKENYNNYNKFYITKKNGQPYIFLLFYLNYPPEIYQKTADLSSPDEYGFGQVEGFDKFDFNINSSIKDKKTVLIGYPDDFQNNESNLKEIKVGSELIFNIKENN